MSKGGAYLLLANIPNQPTNRDKVFNLYDLIRKLQICLLTDLIENIMKKIKIKKK